MKSKIGNITTYEFLDFLEIDIFEICKFSYPRTVKKTMGIEKQHIVTYRVVLRRPAEPRLSAAPHTVSTRAQKWPKPQFLTRRKRFFFDIFQLTIDQTT